MKKVILSALAILGASAFVAPAQAQLIQSSSGGAVTGAASFVNINGSTSTIAAESSFPGLIFSPSATVSGVVGGGTPAGNDVLFTDIVVTGAPDTSLQTATNSLTVEAAVAAEITAATGNVSDQASLIRAWTSGGLD